MHRESCAGFHQPTQSLFARLDLPQAPCLVPAHPKAFQPRIENPQGFRRIVLPQGLHRSFFQESVQNCTQTPPTVRRLPQASPESSFCPDHPGKSDPDDRLGTGRGRGLPHTRFGVIVAWGEHLFAGWHPLITLCTHARTSLKKSGQEKNVHQFPPNACRGERCGVWGRIAPSKLVRSGSAQRNEGTRMRGAFCPCKGGKALANFGSVWRCCDHTSLRGGHGGPLPL